MLELSEDLILSSIAHERYNNSSDEEVYKEMLNHLNAVEKEDKP